MSAKITIKCGEQQRLLWQAAAHDQRLSFSEWVRRNLDKAAAGARTTSPGPSPAAAPLAREEKTQEQWLRSRE